MVTGTQLQWHLTGGTNNKNPFLSLGGEMSSTQIPKTEFDQLWDPVTATQANDGLVEYRWIVLYNTGNETFRNPHFYFIPRDRNVDMEFSRLPINVAPIELDLENIRPSEEEIGPEIDFPMPFTKSTEDYRTTRSIGPNVPPKGKLYICLRRVIEKEAGHSPSIAYTLVVEGGPQ